jgi:hypothetical protein
MAQGTSAANLEFLPGLIVQGHDWTFVAATPAPVPHATDKLGSCAGGGRGEIIIWSKIAIGSTGTIQGICQIVTVLQRLAMWSSRTYWPWIQHNILNLDDETGFCNSSSIMALSLYRFFHGFDVNIFLSLVRL